MNDRDFADMLWDKYTADQFIGLVLEESIMYALIFCCLQNTIYYIANKMFK